VNSRRDAPVPARSDSRALLLVLASHHLRGNRGRREPRALWRPTPGSVADTGGHGTRPASSRIGGALGPHASIDPESDHRGAAHPGRHRASAPPATAHHQPSLAVPADSGTRGAHRIRARPHQLRSANATNRPSLRRLEGFPRYQKPGVSTSPRHGTHELDGTLYVTPYRR
jgi:hypothetical protein